MKPIYLGFDKRFTKGLSVFLRVITVLLLAGFTYLVYIALSYLLNTNYAFFGYLLIGVLALVYVFVTLLIILSKHTIKLHKRF